MASDTLAPPPPRRSASEQKAVRMIPFIVGCALFMQMLDSTVVATALPTMAQALDTTPVKMNVAITSYLLALAVFVPISGWAADRFGARKVFVAAIVLFTVSSAACALAQSLPQLVVARTVQGTAGAMMVPVGRVLLLRMTPKAQLLRAMTFLSMPALLGPIVGPPLGGFLVDYASWHWIFLINIPVGALGVALVLRYIAPDIPEDSARLDWLGFILSGVGLAALVSGFESISHDDVAGSHVLALLGTGLICGLLYIWHARRHDHPIVDLSLLKVRSFAIATLGGNLCRLTVGASPFLLAMMLQVGFGMSAFSAGMITFSSAAGALLMKLVATPVISRFGFKRVLVVNAVIAGVLVMVCGLFNAQTPIWIMIGVLVIGGLSRSLQFTAVNTLTYADLGSREMSRASSFSSMMQQLAISLGVGGAALVLNLSMNLRGADHLEPVDTFWGFMVLGLMACLSMFSFLGLPGDVAQHLRSKGKG
ncbi:MAG TPA: DHA2 family efflux MFS transporter permease subunit [Pusillimonas sp.]|uniref:DHA2 family efflux MFS transporter permease subunit n=2 Tax=unclassified Pusillimonas TaxID=2640016 RepID=UPI00260A16C1|nr:MULTISPECIES: DHA2 family efflux MFS transporter permease subunit [unclassified Pusillimonas]HLU18819.1 DHA2 family efflux MFS transporter permease subunit [Pusillimonas sp.]